jgi:xylan 1,4-beta-xylosidase
MTAYVQRIDEDHANPKRLWVEMGQPEYLSSKEVDQLQQASELVTERQSFTYDSGVVTLKTNLPPHGVAAVTIEFA